MQRSTTSPPTATYLPTSSTRAFTRTWRTTRFVTVIPINFVLPSMLASVERSVRVEDGNCSLLYDFGTREIRSDKSLAFYEVDDNPDVCLMQHILLTLSTPLILVTAT
ncbi:hypothetical protein L1987_63901 [Smallanthus sonchifolius]|uniref:Uncharacterized protein n=1 Tax=Smallanthus sonchifolius TaxID=185202 RepID=A0ACB9CEK0_9ASTR|nr:hypothetical protein L1987_63901 [Smallanthus sonchifolius]